MLDNLKGALDGGEGRLRLALARFAGVRDAFGGLRARVLPGQPLAPRAALCYALAGVRVSLGEQLSAALQRDERHRQDDMLGELEALAAQSDVLALAAAIELSEAEATAGNWEREHDLAAALRPERPSRVGVTSAHARALYDGGLVVLTSLRDQLAFDSGQDQSGARVELDEAGHELEVIGALAQELPSNPGSVSAACDEVARRVDAAVASLEAAAAELAAPGLTRSQLWRGSVVQPPPRRDRPAPQAQRSAPPAAKTLAATPAAPAAAAPARPAIWMIAGLVVALAVGVVGLLVALSPRPPRAATPTPFAADTSSSSVTVPPPSGKVLRSEDFSDEGSGWPTSSSENGSSGYADGAYEIGVTTDQYIRWNTTSASYVDVDVSADVTIVKGKAGDSAAGIVFRELSGSRFYVFEVRADGSYALYKASKPSSGFDTTKLLGWSTSSAIKTGIGKTNNLRVVARGDTFQLIINGVLVDTATDDDYSTGSVGMATDSFVTSGVLARFDNLEIREP